MSQPISFPQRGSDRHVRVPVCSYVGLRAKPFELWPPPPDLDLSPPYENLLGRASYEVCPRCGFEFGNDDNLGTGFPISFDDYRREWEDIASSPSRRRNSTSRARSAPPKRSAD
jgi:hypothetical protein